jgi:hypothetical protein
MLGYLYGKRFGSGYFSSQTFSHISTPTFPTPVTLHTYMPMKMKQSQCSETLVFKIQMPANHTDESIQQKIILFFACDANFKKMHILQCK